MATDWDHHLLYELSQSVEQEQECIVIDDDIIEDEEEVYGHIESEEFVLSSIIDGNNQTTRDFPADEDTIEDLELEVIFDNTQRTVMHPMTGMRSPTVIASLTAMPPLIPLSSPGHQVSAGTKTKTHSSGQINRFESSLETLVKELQSSLECPVCFTIIRDTPVNSCSNGHLICFSCLTRCHVCPVCRVPCHTGPPCYSQLATRMLDLIPLPCVNSDEGCPVVGGRAEIEEHQLVCPFEVVVDRGTGCSELGCAVGH